MWLSKQHHCGLGARSSNEGAEPDEAAQGGGSRTGSVSHFSSDSLPPGHWNCEIVVLHVLLLYQLVLPYSALKQFLLYPFLGIDVMCTCGHGS